MVINLKVKLPPRQRLHSASPSDFVSLVLCRRVLLLGRVIGNKVPTSAPVPAAAAAEHQLLRVLDGGGDGGRHGNVAAGILVAATAAMEGVG